MNPLSLRHEPDMEIYKKLKNLKIALVEDDPWIQSGLETYFRYHDCDLLVFENGGLAIDALSKERVDIIICDYWLPDLDGLTLLRKVLERQPGLVCILVTAYPSDAIKEEAKKLGLHDFIPKPLTIQKLEASLAAVIEKVPGK